MEETPPVLLAELFVIALVLVLLMLFLQSSNLVVDEQQVTIVGLPSDLEGYRILHLSDLAGKRFGDAQSTLLRELNTLDYDAVFLTGDMVGTSGDPEPLYELLEGFSSSTPVYFISGDSDPGPYRETMRDIEGTLDELVYEDWILGTIERGGDLRRSSAEADRGKRPFGLLPPTCSISMPPPPCLPQNPRWSRRRKALCSAWKPTTTRFQ